MCGFEGSERSLASVFPGDEVYVFETLDSEWARGYVLQQPRPCDYSSASVNLKCLPKSKARVGLFPLACIKIVGQSEFNRGTATDEDNLSSSNVELSSTYEDYEDEEASEMVSEVKRKLRRPLLPLTDVLDSLASTSSSDLIVEIKLTLETLSHSIFAVYSNSDFQFFNKLVSIYNELDDLRVSLGSEILTKKEQAMAKKKVTSLMNNFSKLLASGGGMIDRRKHSDSDIDGKECIVARDEDSAELFSLTADANIKSIAKITQSQVLSALKAVYPWGHSGGRFVPEIDTKFDKPLLPSSILVDVKQVIASSPIIPEGYMGMKAYMYLRDPKKSITEAFSINISPEHDLSLDNLAAAMFTNIPLDAITNSRIYLVVLLTETIDNTSSYSTDELNKIEVSNDLPVIRKGIAAGVADISRIFSRKKGHLVSGQSHRFSIKLFSSYLDSHKQEVKLFQGMSSMMAKSMTMVNNGWGELIDRIISGSNRGVAINPRAEQLVLSVKEVKLQPKNKLILDSISNHTHGALQCIPPLGFNTSEKNDDRVFLRLVKTSLNNTLLRDKCYISVHVRASCDSIKFAKGKNEERLKSWKFLSTSPNEYVNELIVVRGLPELPDQGEDFLIFDVYCNKNHVGVGHYKIRNGSSIFDTGIFNKKIKTLDIFNENNVPVGSIEFDLEYFGTTFNVDNVLKSVLSWKSLYGADLNANQSKFSEQLGNIKRVKSDQLISEFAPLCESLISAFETSVTLKLNDLTNSIFNALVLTLDIAVIRNEEHISVFKNMIDQKGSKLAKVGEHLLDCTSEVLSNHESEWNSIGRAISRVLILLVKISVKSFSNTQDFQKSAIKCSSAIASFIGSEKDSLISEQLQITTSLRSYLEIISPWFTVSQLVEFATSWIDTKKLRGLGILPDPSYTALINRKRNKEHSFIVEKLLFVNGLLNGVIISKGSLTDRRNIISAALELSLSVITSDTIDMECSRLAFSILLSICERSFGETKMFYDDSNVLYYELIKLLPLFATEFIRYKEFCAASGLLQKKRIFTDIFLSEYPFEDLTMDSIVNDCAVAEILIEFNVIINTIAKMYQIISMKTDNDKLSKILCSSNELSSRFQVSSLSSTESVFSLAEVCEQLILADYYPKDIWLSLHALSLDCSFIICNLIDKWMPAPTFQNTLLWKKFINNLLSISTSKPIAIEHLEPTPKTASYLLTSDLRSLIAPILQSAWDRLGETSFENKARFNIEKLNGFQKSVFSWNNYRLLYQIFLNALQRDRTCSSVARKIIWSIIATEICSDESLFELERESITSLSEIFRRKNAYIPASADINFFISHAQKWTNQMDPEDSDIVEVKKFIETLCAYLKSLSELTNVPAGDEFDDDRVFHQLNTSKFLMDVDKPELFQSFISEMIEKNMSKNNFVQAALSLELLANTYEWDNSVYLPACKEPELPSQTAFKRKVELYKRIANKFTRGHRLEQAVDIYQEMLDAFMTVNFDLSGISFCHNQLGKLYHDLQTVDRLESTFFKISFIGMGFPDSLRGKQFIYEGLAYERITSINSRLTRLFPGSKIISNDEEASRLLKNKPTGKFMHIKTVSPAKQVTVSEMSFMSMQYVENRNLNTFFSSRRLPGASSILNLWTEETTYTTFMTFPTLMNRSEIKSVTTVKVPPIKNAIKSLLKKNEELSNLEYLIHQNLKDNHSLETISSSSMFESLSRNLAGTVDSPVNGGAGEFKAFLKDSPDIEKGESDEEFARDCIILRKSFNRLVVLLNKLLKLHALIVPDALKPQHECMEELFVKNFAAEIEEGKLDTTTPLVHQQLMESLTTTNIHFRQRHGVIVDESDTGSINYFGHQLTRTSSRTSSIGRSEKRLGNGRHASHSQRSHTHSAQRDDSSTTASDYSHAHDSVNTKTSTINTSKVSSAKRTNLLNYN